jgi:membrane protease YdiL (CAAX protease family)
MLFYRLAFGWSWGVWAAAIAGGADAGSGAGWALLLLGGMGPGLAGVALALRERDGWHDYLRRLVDPRRIPPLLWPVVLLFAPGLVFLAQVATGPPALHLPAAAFASPVALLVVLARVLLLGPLAEEPGWRGWALPRLQARLGPRTAALALGAVWALWHLPLFFFPGTVHAQQGVGSVWFLLFLVQVVAMSVVMAWLFDRTRQSTLGAILFHFAANLAYGLAGLDVEGQVVATGMWGAAAGVLLAVGSKTRSAEG